MELLQLVISFILQFVYLTFHYLQMKLRYGDPNWSRKMSPLLVNFLQPIELPDPLPKLATRGRSVNPGQCGNTWCLCATWRQSLEPRGTTRAGTIHDSKNRKSIQNPDFRDVQVNRESTIRQNEIILLIKELIHESRIDTKSRF